MARSARAAVALALLVASAAAGVTAQAAARGAARACLIDLRLTNSSMALGGSVIKPVRIKIRPTNLVRVVGTVPLALPGACPADRAALAAALPSARLLALQGSGIKMGTLYAKVLFANITVADLQAPAKSTGPMGPNGLLPISIVTTSGATIVTMRGSTQTSPMIGTELVSRGCYLAVGAPGAAHDAAVTCPAGAFDATLKEDKPNGGVVDISVFGHIEAVGTLAAAREVDAADVGMDV